MTNYCLTVHCLQSMVFRIIKERTVILARKLINTCLAECSRLTAFSPTIANSVRMYISVLAGWCGEKRGVPALVLANFLRFFVEVRNV